jgi:hypothetical protein
MGGIDMGWAPGSDAHIKGGGTWIASSWESSEPCIEQPCWLKATHGAWGPMPEHGPQDWVSNKPRRSWRYSSSDGGRPTAAAAAGSSARHQSRT